MPTHSRQVVMQCAQEESIVESGGLPCDAVRPQRVKVGEVEEAVAELSTQCAFHSVHFTVCSTINANSVRAHSQ